MFKIYLKNCEIQVFRNRYLILGLICSACSLEVYNAIVAYYLEISNQPSKCIYYYLRIILDLYPTSANEDCNEEISSEICHQLLRQYQCVHHLLIAWNQSDEENPRQRKFFQNILSATSNNFLSPSS